MVDDSFAALFADIGQDYDAALSQGTTDADGVKHWRDVVFADIPGFRPLLMQVSVPRAAAPPPLIVFVHGGAWSMGSPVVTNPIYRRMDFVGKLIRAGFAVARISYRFSGEGVFPAQLHDCKSAVRFLRNRAQHFGVDPKRFASFGDSAGGHLAAMVGLTGERRELEGEIGDIEGSSAVQVVIDWFGPMNFLTMRAQAIPGGMTGQDDPESPESRLIGGPVQLNREAAKRASPLYYVWSGAPPFHIQHGTHDRLVPVQQSKDLHTALLAAGARSKLHIMPGADHCFWGTPDDGIVERDIAFLREIFG